ncbi:S9 family peptidase [Paradesertivirga mongoliensis]|uniref:S9 family peptidase n=1 Tax=Paradesertivirga mongoliensis TaxID=2100740 RepID=A0ABW4ZN10_9SPHI|nr:S9 family peptidase [Pedobacter mongoliensis]
MKHLSFSACYFVLFQLFFQTAFSQTTKQITLEDIFQKKTFTARTIQSLPSMKDGKSYVSTRYNRDGEKYLAKNSYSTGEEIGMLYKETDLIYNGDTLELSAEFSEDERKVLLSADEEPLYRYSVKANYYVFDIASKKITPVSTTGKQLYATFSPDASKIAFVRENNIFIKDLVSGDEKQITSDGKINHIINGRLDWVYEEEFAFERAFFWSPDSKKIAYYKLNETEVPQYSMTVFDKLYPTQYVYKYPKAGEKNSVVSVHFYNLTDNSTTTADIGKNPDQYIPRIKWTASSNTLCILRMNRHQNKLEYLLSDASTGRSKVILTEEDEQYIDIEKERLTFLDNGRQFINVSERDGFNHLYLYDLNGKIIKQLTKGDWEVTEVYGVDEKNGIIYYQSAEVSPLRRDVYSIKLNGTKKTRLSQREGTNDARFSDNFQFYILSHSAKNTPPYLTLNEKGGKLIKVLEDNNSLKKTIREFGYQNAEFFSFKTSGKLNLNGYMIKPANFDPRKKYPVLMYVYGGPGHQEVSDSWSSSARPLWFQMLAQRGYIIACVDNRGTGYRGAAFRQVTYLQLGKHETTDQTEAAEWLSQQSYVDPSRIGIWGWSYGGYLSSLCITKGADIFKMAIAVAPVTTWRFYDTIYTERYLRTPQENPEGYDQNSPINFADLLKGKFLLVHGTGDDNVHFQNSVMFSEALIQANKPFEQAYYPNKAHGITGGNASIHLYGKMTRFIEENL